MSNLKKILSMEKKYKCFTKQGEWFFYAYDDINALRLALYLCWRDGEDFVRVVSTDSFKPYTLRLCKIDSSNSMVTI